MSKSHFPELIRNLPAYEGRFDAQRLQAECCEVLFASYPAGTRIESHTHDTHNVGLITAGQLILTMGGEVTKYGPGEWYEVAANQEHAASFAVETAEIEFWFAVE
jgi:quercetin dioxygenase-like cupin family protein